MSIKCLQFIFAWDLAACCLYCRGVCYSGVFARTELTVVEV